MQVEEVQKMTCEMEPRNNAEPSGNNSNDEFDGINLEDDIEKVEVTSSDSESSTELFEEFQRNYTSNEEFRNWMTKIKEMQNTIYKKIQAAGSKNTKSTTGNNAAAPPARVMKYQDLPYMGEITLDNSKPRRGRKPKKADICHLIYKNYGTILPGTPNPDNYTQENTKKTPESFQTSSLLEKRLTQEQKLRRKKHPNSNEPMNLCMRDLHPLKLKLTKNSDDTYSTKIKSEPQSDAESDNLNDEYGVPQFLINPHSTPSPESWTVNNHHNSTPNLQQQLNAYYASLNQRPPPDIIPITKPRKIKPKQHHPTPSKIEKSKRKRSAIFIPPISTETNASPATEVSICKFKFTGGAKPSLQEKKMLSVDSGGNFRYYSGTGDKSMRGYEFFPRETLQQTASATQGSSTGAFLQASGEKFYPINEHDEKQVKSEFLLSTELPSTTSPSTSSSSSIHHQENARLKRKSRKSLQREKLERTFKEKGFLIQTQQLESAEGATYCKFRQLRKFTRYLFRSWKDYLPGNVQETPAVENAKNDEMETTISSIT